MRNIFLFLLRFYQKYLSVLFGAGCCRYYPTCSQYAFISFANKNVFIAFIDSAIRIIRCNPLFRSGFDYPQIRWKSKHILCRNTINIEKIAFFIIPIIDNKRANNKKMNTKIIKNKFIIIKKLN